MSTAETSLIVPAAGLAGSRSRGELIRNAIDIGIKAAKRPGNLDAKRRDIDSEIAIIEGTHDADDVTLAREAAHAALEEDMRLVEADDPQENFKAAVRRQVGAGGVTTENFDKLVKTGVAAAQTFLKDSAGKDKKEAVTNVMTDLIDWSVQNEKLSLTAEIGSVLKPLLSQTIEVVYQLLSGQDPDFAAFVTEEENRQALVKGAGLLRRCFGRDGCIGKRCKCCRKDGADIAP